MQDHLWQAVLGEIELSISRASYVTWFKNTQLLRQKDNILTIGVPNVFIKQQLERKYNQLIVDTLAKNGVSPERVDYKIYSGITLNKRIEDDPVILRNETRTVSARPAMGGLSHSYRQGLNEKYTFENFIVGSGNELAHAACQAIAQNPGTKYNPLFIYGGVGIGKLNTR
jgi:chromosomal replication initiator protein